MSSIEIYVHIPFCIRKCNYCDFLSFPAICRDQEAYVKALCHEITAMGQKAMGEEVATIFIGGGTPSILVPDQMQEILKTIFQSFSVREDAEISMEANPGTLNYENLTAYRLMGINRLSMGLQSTEDDCLRYLGRIHTFDEFQKNYQEARRAGFDNINIDLMSALPGQTLSSYEKTLEIVTGLAPEHISSYSLILEEGTPFYENDQLIDLLPDEDTERKMYERTQEILAAHGYERYEISNYAKPGKACRHNLGYWDDVPYIGLGLGASSYWKGARFSNERDFASYLEKPFVEPEEREDYFLLDKIAKMEEYMFLGLRKRNGVSIPEFETRFGEKMDSVYGQVIQNYKDLALLEVTGDRLRLTDAGIDVSNRIFADFLIN